MTEPPLTGMISSLRFRPFGVILAWLFVAASGAAESLEFATLKENEAIVIGYSSQGCFHSVERKYVLRGSARATLAVYELSSAGMNFEDQYRGPQHLLFRIKLSPREVQGLDAYRSYLGAMSPGSCTTVEDIAFGYYRNDVKIGEERFRDASCALRIYRQKGKIVRDQESRPYGMSEEIYNKIVTPALIEARGMEKIEVEPDEEE